MNMRLKLSILMTEHEIQYHLKMPAWEAENWVGPILNRFWALLDLKEAVEAIRGVSDFEFAADYLKQLRACATGRQRNVDPRKKKRRNADGEPKKKKKEGGEKEKKAEGGEEAG